MIARKLSVGAVSLALAVSTVVAAPQAMADSSFGSTKNPMSATLTSSTDPDSKGLSSPIGQAQKGSSDGSSHIKDLTTSSDKESKNSTCVDGVDTVTGKECSDGPNMLMIGGGILVAVLVLPKLLQALQNGQSSVQDILGGISGR